MIEKIMNIKSIGHKRNLGNIAPFDTPNKRIKIYVSFDVIKKFNTLKQAVFNDFP